MRARTTHGDRRPRRNHPVSVALTALTIVGTTLVGPLSGAAGASTTCDDDWTIDANTLTIRARDESLGLLGNDGDEPYLALVPFRVRPGVANSATSWIQGADREPNDDGKTGETFEIPDSMGRASFPDVAPGEVVGTVTLAMEHDATPFSATRAGLDTARAHITSAVNRAMGALPSTEQLAAQVLKDLTDSSTANDTAAIDRAVAQVRALPARVRAEMPNPTSLFLSVFGEFVSKGGLGVLGAGIVDPDGFGGASIQVYANVDPLRSIVNHPLVPSSARTKIAAELAALDNPTVTNLTSGVQMVVASLTPQYRRLSYSFDGTGALLEHIDADGRYEVPALVASCSDSAEPGQLHVDALATDGVTATRVSTEDWTSGWNVSEMGVVSGTPILFNLKETSGRVEILGRGSASWTSGWTDADIVDVAGTSHLVVYKRSSGRIAVRKLTSSNLSSIGSETHDTTVVAGFTSVRAFTTSSGTFIIFLNSQSGRMEVRPLSTSGKVGAAIDVRTWSAGWTTAETFTVGGTPYLLINKAQDGLTRIHALDSTGKVGTMVSSQTLPVSAPGWGTGGQRVATDRFSVYPSGTSTLIQRVNEVTGHHDIRRVQVSGATPGLSAAIASARWSAGWTSVEHATVGGTTTRYLLKSGM